MRASPISSLCLAAASLLPAQEGGVAERDFTNTAGKTIRASVVRIEGANVRLKVGSDTFSVSIATLDEAGKTYLKGWLAENPSYAFRFAAYQREGASPIGGTMAPVSKPKGIPGQPITAKEVPEDLFHYELKVINDSGIKLNDVDVHYRVFVKVTKRGEFSGIYFDQIGGSIRIPFFQPGPGNLVRTGTVSLTGTRDKKVKTTTVVTRGSNGGLNITSVDDVTRESERSEPAGVWFRLYHRGRLIEEYQDLSDEVSKRKPAWDENVPMIQGTAIPGRKD